MNVASLELSRDLHELSGWEGESHPNHGYEDDNGGRIPYFTVGYLLRKLPHSIKLGPLAIEHQLRIEADWASEKWWVSYSHIQDVQQWADHPEDALCQLAIQLFKQGILTKTESGDVS